jgi:hypothetical protein
MHLGCIHSSLHFKGSLTRDLLLQVFIMIQLAPGPLGSFQISTKIRGDIHRIVFIPAVVDTSDNLFTGVKDTADKLLPVSSLLPAINYCQCH